MNNTLSPVGATDKDGGAGNPVADTAFQNYAFTCDADNGVWEFTITQADATQVVVVIEVNCPIPTVSEWGLVVMTLLLLSAATIVIGYKKPAIAGADGAMVSVETSASKLDSALFAKMMCITLGLAVAGLLAAKVVAGSVQTVDIGGAVVSAVAAAYLLHLWVMLKKRE